MYKHHIYTQHASKHPIYTIYALYAPYIHHYMVYRYRERIHRERVLPILHRYVDVEAALECSAGKNLGVRQVFYFAQKAVVYVVRFEGDGEREGGRAVVNG